ncbi:MAG: EamA family transporter [Candidatus Rokuibacteriota bacterium]|nr:MAG: EamA family transporter [Candidatus Rokubacteria bacterium]
MSWHTGGRHALRAAGWMASSIASFVLMAVAARQLSTRMSTMEILCLRSAVGLAVLLAIRGRLGPAAYVTHRLPLHIARNVVHFFGQYAWVYGIALAPLALVTAIEFTTPVWVALLAAVLLGERIPPARWVAIGSGLAGVLIVARPGASAFDSAALIVLGGALCFAAAIVTVKSLLRSDRVTAVVFYMNLIQLPMGLAGSWRVWVWPAWSDLPWAVAIGLTSLTAHYSMGRALSLADASMVLPIDFLRLPCIALAALLIYGERIDGWTMLGAAIICAGNYWSMRSEVIVRGRVRSGSVPEAAGS